MQQRSEDTHKNILSTSTSLFSLHGYAATSVDQICITAGISKGAFYHHFPNKHTLFVEILDNWLISIKTRIDQKFLDSSEFPSGFLDIADSLQEIIGNSREKLPLLLEFWQQSQKDQNLWQKAVEPFYKYQNYFLDIVKNGAKNSAIKIEDPVVFTKVILAFSLGLMTSNIIDPETNWEIPARFGFNALFTSLQRSTS